LKSFYEWGGARGRIMEGMKQTEVYYMHIWKYHNKTPVQLLYLMKMFTKKKRETEQTTCQEMVRQEF
jgi:hypothetical protein